MEASFIAGAKMEKACAENGFEGWFVTSAKSGVKIVEAMECLIEKMREKFPAPKAIAAEGCPRPAGGPATNSFAASTLHGAYPILRCLEGRGAQAAKHARHYVVGGADAPVTSHHRTL